MSPSLGWLQAFLAVADHNDYEQAAKVLGVDANRVKLRVEKLERWLHKILIMDHPTDLNPDDGVQFIPVAWDALRKFEAACASSEMPISVARAHKMAGLISKLRLHDLERFLAVADMGDFKGAADVARCNVTTVQRSIRDLEKVTGTKLLSGRSMLALSDDGAKFRETAQAIVDALNGFRAKIPDDYNEARERAKRRYRFLKFKRAELLSMKGLVERTGRKQRGKTRLADVEASLKFAKEKMDEIVQEFGSFESISGLEVDVSELDLEQTARREAGG